MVLKHIKPFFLRKASIYWGVKIPFLVSYTDHPVSFYQEANYDHKTCMV